MKIYDLILELLTDTPALRNSDKRLMWTVWNKTGYIEDGYSMQEEDFIRAISPETIRRCRQKIQQLHPELQANNRTKGKRKSVELQRGTYIYRVPVITQERFI